MAKEIKFNVKFNIDGRQVLAVCTADARELSKQLGKVKDTAEKTATVFERFGKVKDQFDKTTQALDSLTAESNQFAAAMREANTMAGKSGADFDQLKGKVNELSHDIPIARDLLAKGLYQVVSNGVPEDNWISYLQASAKASVGGLADLEEVVKVTSTVIKNYGLDWSEAQNIQDKIQLTAKNGVTSFEQLAQALPRVTGNAATLGISVDELMASFATLTGVSGNTAEVSTQLAAIMTALVKPTSEATTMAKELGIQFDAAAVKAAGGLSDFLQQTDYAVQAYAQKTGQTAQTIYGKLFGSAESLRALIPLTGELKDKFNENLGAMNDSANTMSDAFDIMNSSAGAAIQKIKNHFGTFTDVVASAYNTVKPITDGIGQALDIASNLGVVTQSLLALNTALKPLGGLVAVATKQLSLWIGQAKASAAANWLLYGSTKGVAGGATAAAGSLNVLKIAMRGVIAAMGIGAVLAGLGLIIGTLIDKFNDWRSTMGKTEKALTAEERAARSSAEVHKTLSDAQAEGARRAAEETVKIKTLSATIHDANASYESRRAAIAELQKIVPSYHASLTREGGLIERNAVAVDKYCDMLKKKAIYEAAQDKLKGLADQKINAAQAQGGWRNAVKVRQKRVDDENKRYNDLLNKLTDNGKKVDGYTGQAVSGLMLDHERIMNGLTASLEAAQQKVLDYGDSWNTATKAENELAEMANKAYQSMSNLLNVGNKGGGAGGTGKDTPAKVTTSAPAFDYSERDRLNKQMKPVDVEANLKLSVKGNALRDQISLIDRQLQAADLLPVATRVKLANDRQDLQDQLDQLTGAKGGTGVRLTVEAVPEVSTAYGSAGDKFQSRQNAQSRAQHLTELVELKFLGQDEAQSELDQINAKLRSIGAQPVTLDVQVNTEQAMTKMEKFSGSMDKMQSAWSAVTGISSDIETLTDTLEGSGTVWEKVQAVMNATFSTFSNISQLLQQFTPLTKAATAATKGATVASEGHSAANASEGMSAAGAAIGEATKSGARLPFPANIAAIAAGVAAVVSVIATMASCFETGGIVGGASFTGDRVPVRVNSGEMILNRRQQATLFKIANGQFSALSSVPSASVARGADLSAPRLSDLRALSAAIRPQQVEVTVSGKIKGRDIHLANDRRARLLSKC